MKRVLPLMQVPGDDDAALYEDFARAVRRIAIRQHRHPNPHLLDESEQFSFARILNFGTFTMTPPEVENREIINNYIRSIENLPGDR